MPGFAASVKSSKRYTKNALVPPKTTQEHDEETKDASPNNITITNDLFAAQAIKGPPSKNKTGQVPKATASFASSSIKKKSKKKKTKKINGTTSMAFSTIAESTIEEGEEGEEESENFNTFTPTNPTATKLSALTMASPSPSSTKSEWAAQWTKSSKGKPTKQVGFNVKHDDTDFDDLLYTAHGQQKTAKTLSDIDMDAIDMEENDGDKKKSSSSGRSSIGVTSSKTNLLAPKASSSNFTSQARRAGGPGKKTNNAFAAWTTR